MFLEWLKEFGIMLGKLLIAIISIIVFIGVGFFLAKLIITSFTLGICVTAFLVLIAIGFAAFCEVSDKY